MKSSLSDLIEFTPQFESHESRLCCEKLCLPIQKESSNLNYDTDLKIPLTTETLYQNIFRD